jgi:biotin carboxyl carrier protein
MEIPVYSPCDGTVSEIRVKKGDKVEEDDVLAVID